MIKNMLIISSLLAAAGCAEYRTHSSYVAHVDNTNILLYEADKLAVKNSCYDSDSTRETRRQCINDAADYLTSLYGYNDYDRSLDVVNDLESKEKVALTEEGDYWYFTTNDKSDLQY